MSEFARLDPARIDWLGERPAGRDAVDSMRSGALYAWPGFGEAYGLAYLEAQAAGLPVVAQDIDGVPGVVRNGETGILTPPGDVGRLCRRASRRLLDDRAAAATRCRRPRGVSCSRSGPSRSRRRGWR